MVGTTGIEPVTPAMSMQCSPAELRALVFLRKGVFSPIHAPWQGLVHPFT
jgi:hypothetical protein